MIKRSIVLLLVAIFSILIVSCINAGSTEPEKIADSFSYVASPFGTAVTLTPTLQGAYSELAGKQFTLARTGTGGTGGILPTIVANTGAVSITATTTAGTYKVTLSAPSLAPPITAMVYVTTKPADKVALDAALQNGIASFGLTADFNYIITSDITDMYCLFAVEKDIQTCSLQPLATQRPYLDNFNGDISKWDVSKVTDMNELFISQGVFNTDISNWDVSNVTSMHYMFASASAFNGNIGKWKVSKVTNMNSMFNTATTASFNQDISGWDVSNVTTMSNMFENNRSFNQDISGWNISNVTNMTGMFRDATAFNKNLDKWRVANSVTKTDMFTGSGLAANQPCWITDVANCPN